MEKYYHLFNASLFIIIVAAMATFLLAKIPLLEPINDSVTEWDFTDLYYRDNPKFSNSRIDTNIVIANIAKLSRAEIGMFLNEVNNHFPKVVGMNVFFSSNNNNDSVLVKALENTNSLVMAATVVYDTQQTRTNKLILKGSQPIFTKNAATGLVDVVHGTKNVIRSFISYEDLDNSPRYYNFSIELLRHFDPGLARSVIERLQYEEIIKYQGRMESYYAIDYAEDGKTHFYTVSRGKFGWETTKLDKSLDFVNNKIVLFGFLGTNKGGVSFEDLYNTPLRSEYLSFAAPDMYSVAIHANIISMYLNNDSVIQYKYWRDYYCWLILLFFLFSSQLLRARFKWYNQLLERGVAMIFIFILIFLSISLFSHGIYVDLTLAVFWLLFAADANELYQKTYIPVFASMSATLKKVFIFTPLVLSGLILTSAILNYLGNPLSTFIQRILHPEILLLIFFLTFFGYAHIKKPGKGQKRIS